MVSIAALSNALQSVYVFQLFDGAPVGAVINASIGADNEILMLFGNKLRTHRLTNKIVNLGALDKKWPGQWKTWEEYSSGQ